MVAVVISAFFAWATSRHNEFKAKEKQDKGADNYEGSDTAAFINAITHKQKTEREQTDRYKVDQVFREWLTLVGIIIAGGSALYQVGILIEQAKSLQDQVVAMQGQLEEMKKAYGPIKDQAEAARDAASAAKTSAEAAKQSADATLELERPRLIIGTANLIQPNGKTDPDPKIDYSFLNIGRSSATIRSLYIDCMVVSALPLVPEIKRSKLQAVQFTIGSNAAFPSGKGMKSCQFDRPIANSDYDDIASGRKHITLLVVAAYDGALDISYSYSAAIQITIADGLTAVWGGSSYNNEDKTPGAFQIGGPRVIPRFVP
jgi:hypothetical protein